MKTNAIVIGAGLGGLSSAIVLASKGFQVTLLEKNAVAGGKMSEVQLGAYRFDTGPSLLTMKFVIEELFNLAGKPIKEYLNIQPIDPICRYFYPDGTILNAWKDIPAFIQDLPPNLAHEARAVEDFFKYAQKIYELTSDLFLFDEILKLRHLLNSKAWKTLLNLGAIDPFRTVHQANTSFFQSPHLQNLFDRYATYNGSDPFQAPATLNIIPHVEYALGAWYVEGGMYRLAQALTRLASELGVKTLYECDVKAIQHDGKQVKGVSLASGETIPAPVVVSNADVVYTHSKLLNNLKNKGNYWEQKEPSCSGLVFLWAVDKSHPQLSHHNILFPENYKQEFTDIFANRTPPSDPAVYISITAKSNPDHAPEGGENWFVLVNMPWLKDHEHNSPEEIATIRTAILSRIQKAGLGDVRPHIREEQVLSPTWLRDRTNTNKGSIYGLSSNNRNAAFMRQTNKSSLLRGLYFAGGSAHPGGGIPLVILSGIHAANAVNQDFR
jgi:phytoene desaturase